MATRRRTIDPVLLMWATLGLIVLGACPDHVRAEENVRVGQIFIVGNRDTPDYVVRYLLPFRPGETVSAKDLQRAESRLRAVGLWDMPTVEILPSSGMPGPKDLLVTIEERPANWLLFAAYELTLFRLTGDLERLNYVGLRIRTKIVGPE